MHWVILALAAIAALGGAGILLARAKTGAELALMIATETSKAGHIAGKAPGTLVEIKGNVRTDAPLNAEFSGTPAVWYRSMVEREVQRQTRDGDGKSRNERTYETESDQSFHAPARLEDASGSVALDFEGAKVEAAQVHRRYEAATVGVIAGLLNVSGTILGHRYTEWAIAPDAALYVLGTALPGGKVGKAPDRANRNPFVISVKSEEERERSLAKTRVWQLVGAIACFILAAALLYHAAINWGT